MKRLKKITFSHSYNKMPFYITDKKVAKLLHIFLVDKDELSEDFIEYDTAYIDADPTGAFYENNKQNYPLPKNDLIILLLLSNGLLWTTIRRWTPQKYTYYKGSIGEDFEIVTPDRIL